MPIRSATGLARFACGAAAVRGWRPSMAGATSMVLTWTSVPGVTYRIEYASDATAGGFQLHRQVTAGAASMSLTVPADANRLFYRVVPEP
jgi:hypothetical protein